jgi:hypothetical protein
MSIETLTEAERIVLRAYVEHGRQGTTDLPGGAWWGPTADELVRKGLLEVRRVGGGHERRFPTDAGIQAAVETPAVDAAKESVEFHPENLAKSLQALNVRARAQFAKEQEESHCPPMAEQFYRLALAALEQAESYARLADYNLSRGE